MKRHLLLIAVTVFIFAGLSAFAYFHRADMPILSPHGPVGLAERSVIQLAVFLPLIVVVPVFFLLFFFAWRYRASRAHPQKEHSPDWDHDSRVAEAIWWFVPAAIIAVLGVVTWQSSHLLDPYKPLASKNPPITIQVVALDWKWLFIYPAQGIATVNMVEFPENTPVHFELTADAPMNSFWIPSLGGQIMAMPGMQTQLNLMANDTGSFNGVSANISGAGFAGMNFTAKSVTPSDFTTWVQTVQQGGGALSEDEYKALAKPSQYVPVRTYATVDSGLYNAIIMAVMDKGSL